MVWIDLVTVLALVQLIFFSVLVARARGRYGVAAPAVTGHEIFERIYRVQMNTLELLVAFVPALYLAARYWDPGLAAAAGAVFLVGRLIYWRAYVKNPGSRTLGFALSALPTLVLLLAALIGILRAALGG